MEPKPPTPPAISDISVQLEEESEPQQQESSWKGWTLAAVTVAAIIGLSTTGLVGAVGLGLIAAGIALGGQKLIGERQVAVEPRPRRHLHGSIGPAEGPVNLDNGYAQAAAKDAQFRTAEENNVMADAWLEYTRNGNKIMPGFMKKGRREQTLKQLQQSYSHVDLESEHQYIQVLFPNREPSPKNPKAPILTDKMVSEVHKDEKLQRATLKNLDLMLDFWGLSRKGDQITVDRTKTDRHRWCKHGGDHNDWRVTRVLLYLMETGYKTCAISLADAMNKYRDANGQMINTHWVDAVAEGTGAVEERFFTGMD